MPSGAPAVPYVIAVDAGGTYTRVGCFGRDGSVLSMRTGGGGSPSHNDDAPQNVRAAVVDALEAANLRAEDAVALAAGMAAISRHRSNDWADAYFDLPGLTCPRTIVNDAVIAHRGALIGEPGVIVVAGTGSMILGITENGDEVESGRFEHYAGGARHLVFDLMNRILVGAATADDLEFVDEVLAYWQAPDFTQLRRILLDLDRLDRNDIKRLYGNLAPSVTAAADRSPIADAAVRELAAKTATGVQLLAALIDRDPVPVALAGGLATDTAFLTRLGEALAANATVPAKIVTPALEPVGGAALLALQLAEGAVGADVIDRLAVSAGTTRSA
jgi:glucosamine kinase